ncbi:hypothetical protein PFISCL1PPCAC_3185, partial [Pristionchus fissidentatus]
ADILVTNETSLFTIPNEILTKICLLLPFGDRKSLGSTCHRLYRFERDVGQHRLHEVDAIKESLQFVINPQPRKIDKRLIKVTQKMAMDMFKKARIHDFYFTKVKTLPTIAELDVFRSATLVNLIVSNCTDDLHMLSRIVQALLMDKSKLESISLHWTIDVDLGAADRQFFRELPAARHFVLSLFQQEGGLNPCDYYEYTMDDSTLLNIVAKFDVVVFRSLAFRSLSAPAMVRLFKIVCNSTKPLLVGMGSYSNTLDQLIELLGGSIIQEVTKNIVPIQSSGTVETETFRDRSSGTVLHREVRAPFCSAFVKFIKK